MSFHISLFFQGRNDSSDTMLKQIKTICVFPLIIMVSYDTPYIIQMGVQLGIEDNHFKKTQLIEILIKDNTITNVSFSNIC